MYICCSKSLLMTINYNILLTINYNIADGEDGMVSGKCVNRSESSVLSDKTKSLVFVNHFRSVPVKQISCLDNSESLISVLDTCHVAAANRWPNFIAVDFYEVNDMGFIFPYKLFITNTIWSS